MPSADDKTYALLSDSNIESTAKGVEVQRQAQTDFRSSWSLKTVIAAILGLVFAASFATCFWFHFMNHTDLDSEVKHTDLDSTSVEPVVVPPTPAPAPSPLASAGSPCTSTSSCAAGLVCSDPVYTVSSFAGGVRGYEENQDVLAKFNNPYDITVDGAGNFYVADTYNSAIRKISASGAVSTLAGDPNFNGHTDGFGAAAWFNYPMSVSLDSTTGSLYIADYYASTIRKIDSTGYTSTFSGTAGVFGYVDGSAKNVQYHFPSAVAVDSVGGFLYVLDAGNNVVRKVSLSTGKSSTLAGSGTAGYANGFGTAAQFNNPNGIALDKAGNLYVADTGNQVIRMITGSGQVSTIAGVPLTSGYQNGPVASALFNGPVAVDIHPTTGDLIVSDRDNTVIRRISSGVVSLLAGTPGVFGSADGPATSATFYEPRGIAITPNGNLYAIDIGNDKVRLITLTSPSVCQA